MSSTTAIDSSAIGLLATLAKSLIAHKGCVCLAALSPTLKKTVTNLKADRVFQLFATVDDADTAFNDGIRKEERGFYALIKLPEELTLQCISPLREIIDNALATGNTVLVFDFSRTTIISSVGIGLLMHLQKNLRARDGGLYLVGINSAIRHQLDSANVLQVIQEFRTIEDVEKKLL
jgi:anti-anti-sigma factor